MQAVIAERAFLKTLDGDCKTPIAGQARIVDGAVEFRGLVAKPDGSEFYEVTRSGSIEDAARIGDDAGLQIQKDAGMDFFTWLKQDAVAAASAGEAMQPKRLQASPTGRSVA